MIDTPAIVAALDALTGDPATLRRGAATLLKAALANGRARIAKRLARTPGDGLAIAGAYADLTDAVVTLVHDFTLTRLFTPANRTAGERLAVIALGGWGRQEMALHSDVDILLLSPGRRAPWVEQRAEAMLYLLWDLGLKLGSQNASVDEAIRLAAADMSVRTALLEARFLCGDAPLADELFARYASGVQAGTAPAFAAAKLAERNARHVRVGDSRYVVEPNVKEGKGGLRDLHTLLWIGKYAYRARRAPELVDRGLFTVAELRRFARAERFFWAVRCHLHIISNRAEERLGFDAQREIAGRMRYADRPGKAAVERFMQFYFRQAKAVGDLTGVFLAQLDEDFAERGLRFGIPAIVTDWLGGSAVKPFTLERGRISVPTEDAISEGSDFFAADPVRLLRLYAFADRHGREIHPRAQRMAARDTRLIGADVRADPEANALFLDVLASRRDPERVLRWMNEAGVLGRFVPDFGRVVAQMQFDMYHHYTVDEHTIRAIGLLSRIERGEEREAHPLATALFRQVAQRRALYVAVLLHDVAKGRGGDHSELGAAVAERLGPRLGLAPAETETVAWAVRHHLLMSRTAFKRDLADPKTIADFAAAVQSPDRLRLLLILTAVDIAAVGPGTFTAWKRQLLRDLYDAAEERLRLGHRERGRDETRAIRWAELAALLGWTEREMAARLGALPDSWWIAESVEVQRLNALHLLEAADDRRGVSVRSWLHAGRGATLVSVVAADRPGLFHRVVTAISAAGGNIIDARAYTGSDGRALDNFLVGRADGCAFDDPDHLARLAAGVREAVDGRADPSARLAARAAASSSPPDAATLPIAPVALIDTVASNRFTVVEVNAAERPALLSDLTRVLSRTGFAIASAHVATHGARAVDVFYLTDEVGEKVTDAARLDALRDELEAAAAT